MMSAAEYRQSIAALGLSQTHAALFLGVGHRTVLRWTTQDDAKRQEIPKAVASLLRVMLAQKITVQDVNDLNAECDERGA